MSIYDAHAAYCRVKAYEIWHAKSLAMVPDLQLTVRRPQYKLKLQCGSLCAKACWAPPSPHAQTGLPAWVWFPT